jgi:probable F420-dependent oxidoreductase
LTNPLQPLVAFSVFVTTESAQPGQIAELVEHHGADALLFPEHTHLPAGPAHGHPGGLLEVPPEYARVYDPLMASAAAAATTSHLRVGTAVCLLNQRDPIITAKEVATLDQLCQGRVIFGVGAGWHEGEMANHGVDPKRRIRALRERVEAITAIWTQDTASYQGETLSFGSLQSWPKPYTRPRPPLLLGGNGPRAHVRALAWADGWMPHTEYTGDDALLARIAGVRSGSEPAFDITLAMSPADPARLEAYRRAGVKRFLFQLPSGGLDAIERRIDRVFAAVGRLG